MNSAEKIGERLERWPISLMAESSTVSPSLLIARYGDCPLVACDFYVDGAEHAPRIPGGFRIGKIDNVDHHAPVPEMATVISSANLALNYVGTYGPVEGRRPVIIHHTDCDSILSSAMVQGVLLPDLRFGRAAIAADHTGQENAIADLLQSMERFRDIDLSLRSLGRLMSGEPLPREAAAALQERMEERALARRSVEDGVFHWHGRLAHGTIAHGLDTAFVVPLLPDAALIMVARPNPAGPYAWKNKIRLGMAAPPGASILELGITDFDPNFGGRWNAGSNRRAGGTNVDPETYADFLAEAIRAWA